VEVVSPYCSREGVDTDNLSYIVYIAILACYLVFAYFMYPETKNRTIEEVSVIFDNGLRGDQVAAGEAVATRIGVQPGDEVNDGASIRSGGREKAETEHADRVRV
jgi:hypothetical protein